MANAQLAANLHKYRKFYNYTQEDLSNQFNISRQAYSNYERGKRDPDLDLLIRICEFYGLTLDQLIHQPFRKSTAMSAARRRSQTKINLLKDNDTLSGDSTVIKETYTSYFPAVEADTNNRLYLTPSEFSLLMKFREAPENVREIIQQLLSSDRS